MEDKHIHACSLTKSHEHLIEWCKPTKTGLVRVTCTVEQLCGVELTVKISALLCFSLFSEHVFPLDHGIVL